MKYIKTICLCALFFLSSSLLAENHEGLLLKSDEKVFPKFASYKMTIVVENESGKKSQTLLYGFKKGSYKNVIIIKEPKKNAGTVEMRKDNSIWVYFSTNGKTMKSAFQSLAIGEDVCYGDILTNDLAYDYNVVSVTNKNTDSVLELKPKPKHEGYARLLVTIDGKTLLPKKKEYYALSGTLLKVCEIASFEFGPDGKVLKFVQNFYDPLKDKKSYVTVENIKELSESGIPEKYYNESQLKFLSQK
jgi:outer membrane lipoprotein-sorting protein